MGFDLPSDEREKLAKDSLTEAGKAAISIIRMEIGEYVAASKADRVLKMSAGVLAILADPTIEDDVRKEIIIRRRRRIAHAIDTERLLLEDAAADSKERVLEAIFSAASTFGEAAVKLVATAGVQAVKAAVSGGALGLLI